MKIRVLRSARITIMDGFRFYDNQEPGLGGYFVDSIMADIRSLTVYAGIHEIAYGRYHRMVCSTFPFSIFYTVGDSEVLIYAVLDNRQDPVATGERLT